METSTDVATRSAPPPVLGGVSSPGNACYSTNFLASVMSNMGASADTSNGLAEKLTFDPAFVDEAARLKLSDFRSAIAIVQRKKTYACKYVTSVSDIDKLQRSYPNYNICSGADVEGTNHPFARELRMLEHLNIYDHFIRYNDEVTLANGYDFLVKDVGGNPIIHDIANRSKVHVCFALCGVKDTFRHADFRKHVQRTGIDAKVSCSSHPIVRNYLSNDVKRNVCHNLSQHCQVKAPILTFIHSIYDMSLDDFGACFDSSNAEEAYIVMVYSPEMLFYSSGYLEDLDCKWKKFKLHEEMYISFNFSTDSSVAYTHKFDTYKKLVQSTHFTTPKGDLFFLDREYRNGTVQLRATKSYSSVVPKELILRQMKFPDSDNVRYVATYKYDILGTTDKMEPVLIKTTAQFFDKLTQYAVGLQDTKFTVDAVRRYAVTCNCTVNVGTVITSGPNHSVEDVITLAYTAYMYVYIRNYASSRAVQSLVKDEEIVRQVQTRFDNPLLKMIYRWYKNLYRVSRKSHPILPDKGEYDENTFVNELEKSTRCRNDLMQWMESKVPDFRRKYPIVVSGPRVMTTMEVMNENVFAQQVPSYSYVSPISKQGYLSSEYVEKYSNLKNEVRDNPYLMTIISYAKARRDMSGSVVKSMRQPGCHGHFTVVDRVPGDGNCFYHCLIKYLKLQITPSQMRTRLLNSKFLNVMCAKIDMNSDYLIVDTKEVTNLRNRLSPSEVINQDQWADDAVVLLAALEYSITICVHQSDCSFKYNAEVSITDGKKLTSGIVVHLLLNSNHFELLSEDVSDLESCEHFDLEYDDEQSSFEYQSVSDILLQVSVKTRDPDGQYVDATPPKIIRDYRDYSSSCVPHSTLHKYGYDSLYGPMLSCALNLLGDRETPRRVLDVDSRNRSSLQVLCDTKVSGHFAQVTSLSLSHAAGTSVNNTFRKLHARRSLWKTGPKEFDKLFFGQTFDLITINPAFYSDELGRVDHSLHDQHINRLLTSLKYLANGGTAIICLTMPITEYSVKLMSYFLKSRTFEKVSLVIPSEIVPCYLPWCFLMCDKFNPPSTSRFSGNYFSDISTEVSKINSYPAIMSSTIESINSEYAVGLAVEVGNILNKEYEPPSTAWVDKVKTLVPTRMMADISAGYLPPMKLPAFSPSVPVDVLEISGFSHEYMKTTYGKNFSHMLKPTKFPIVIDNYSKYVRDVLLKHLGINISLVEDQIRDILLQYVSDVGEHDEFIIKYLVVYYIALKNKEPYVRLKLTTKDIGKPLTSTMFYSSKLSINTNILMCDLKEKFLEVFAPGAPLTYVPPLQPDNPEIFDTTGVISSTAVVDISDIDSGKFYSLPDTNTVEPAGGELDTASQDNKVFLYKPYDLVSSGNYKTALLDYFNEYMTLTETTVNYQFEQLKMVIDNVVKFRGMRSDGDIFEQNVIPFVGKDYVEGCVLKIDGKFLLGGELVNTAEFTKRRYLVSFDLKREGNVFVCDHSKTHIKSLSKKREALPKNFLSVKALEVFMEKDIVDSLQRTIPNPEVKSITITQAGPGCGKTYDILSQLANNPDKNYLAIMKNHENVVSAKSRLRAMLNKKIAPLMLGFRKDKSDSSIVSIDVVLQNIEQYKSTVYEKVFVDEAMTHHSGKIAALTCAFSCDLMLYGDIMQIGYICRINGVEPKYPCVANAYPITRVLDKSYRCPADICYELSPNYVPIADALGINYTDEHLILKSESDAPTPSVEVIRISSATQVVCPDDCQLLTFTQSEKTELQNVFKNAKPVHTIHEFQGNESPKVAIVRLRVIDDACGLYARDDQIVSGISRHTSHLTYYTVKPDDALSVKLTKLNVNYRPWRAKSLQ